MKRKIEGGEADFFPRILPITDKELFLRYAIPCGEVLVNRGSLDPRLLRKAERIAPWLPDNPPKKPDSMPPSGRYFRSKASFCSFGTRSNRAKTIINTPITSLTKVISNVRPPI